MMSDKAHHGGLEALVSSLDLEELHERGFRASATVRRDCAVFQGHFPDNPVLPGAFHLWIAYLLLRDRLGESLALRSVRRARFKKILVPGDAIVIQGRLKRLDGGGLEAHCKILKEGREASKFTLILGGTR
jgi:3-hydroxymyristoyl/3-hydroxydecanoyl-(acyl carrier protein) dehydratase